MAVACPTCRAQFEVDRFEPDTTMVACPDCGTPFQLGQGRIRTVEMKRIAKKTRRDPATDIAAFLVSLIIPGVGHIVKQRFSDGIIWFVAAVGCVAFGIGAGQSGLAIIGVGLVAIVSAISAAIA